MWCWLPCGVAGAWCRRSWLGDAAGPAPRLPRAPLPGQRGSSHCGLPVPRAPRAGKPLGECRRFAPGLNVAEVSPPRNTAFELGSLIHVPERKPPASPGPGGCARPGCAAARSGADFRRSRTFWLRGGLSPCVVCALAPLLLMLPVHMCPLLTAMPAFKWVVFVRGSLGKESRTASWGFLLCLRLLSVHYGPAALRNPEFAFGLWPGGTYLGI